MSTHLDPQRRHDFVFFFDVTDGNPNGDPDAGNQPRTDPETGQGLVTDVCVKRKIRDYVDAARGTEERYKIYVEHRSILTEKRQRAYAAAEIKPDGTKSPKDEQKEREVREWMCQNFFDIRTFGAVMTLQANCGQVRGPVQLTFSRSIDRVTPLDLSIVRVAVEDKKDAEKQQSGEGEGGRHLGTMGRKTLLPYGLYRGHGFVNPFLAERTGFDGDDLGVLWEAIQRGWELDRSASRGMIAFRGLYVFSHENSLGNASASSLFDRVTAERVSGIETPRRFADYQVDVRRDGLPVGIELTEIV